MDGAVVDQLKQRDHCPGTQQSTPGRLGNEYLVAENGILRAHLPGLRLSDSERVALAEIGRRLGRKGLQQVAYRQTGYDFRLVSQVCRFSL